MSACMAHLNQSTRQFARMQKGQGLTVLCLPSSSLGVAAMFSKLEASPAVSIISTECSDACMLYNRSTVTAGWK